MATLTAKRRKETGAFYTPDVFADLAVESIAQFISEEDAYIDNLIFFDPFAGEGALLRAVKRRYPYARCWASTLEQEDANIIRRDLGIGCDVLDFYNTDWSKEIIVKDCNKHLVIITNPPYENFAKADAEETLLYQKYQNINKTTMALLEIMSWEPYAWGTFSKPFYWGVKKLEREVYYKAQHSLVDVFMFPSTAFAHISKPWAVQWSLHIKGEMSIYDDPLFMRIYEKNGKPPNLADVVSYDDDDEPHYYGDTLSNKEMQIYKDTGIYGRFFRSDIEIIK